MERLLQTKGSLLGLVRSMNVVLILNETSFLKYMTMLRFQREFMSERFKRKVISEYWGVFIIRYIHNGDECVIEHYVVMGVNITCGKVQYQREITVISRTITKKDATPGLWLPSGKLLTV